MGTGGALSRVGPRETAIGARNSPFLLEILANWEDPALSEANIFWARAVFDEIHSSSHAKPNVNFPGVDDAMASFVSAAFADQYERLRQVKRKYDRQVKRKYDPANVFRINQNVT